jgi:pyruvate,water dikinase
MISSSYTHSYGLFRDLFLHTGKHLTEMGFLLDPDDVFYLSLDEHEHLLKGMEADMIPEIQQKIKRVKEEMLSYRDITLPSVIYGDTPPPITAPDDTILTGIPTSPGIFTGQVVVVKGYKDFKKDLDGKILVIPFSDVGWTPILSRAGAIVAESGGILSHASIIARELTVPAISSVDHACTLKDGIKARVDGYNGTLSIEP